MDVFQKISAAIQSGDRDAAAGLTREAMDGNMDPAEVLKKGLVAGMDVVGTKFRDGDIFIPQVLIAARAMHAAMDILRPTLVSTGAKQVGRVIIGTVEGDHHDIGKNLVAMMLEGKGFEVVDLGINVPTGRFVEEVKKGEAQVLGMSALLSTTRPVMKEIIDALKKEGLRDRVIVMVGGGAVTREFAREIGADGYGQDAASSAETAVALIGAGTGGAL